MIDVIFETRIDDKLIPIEEFNIVGGAYGSVGHVTMKTSRTALDDAGIDLFSITSSKPGFTEIDISVQILDSSNAQSGGIDGNNDENTTNAVPVKMFGGEYLNTAWDLDHDQVTIKARDWAGQLNDQKRVLTKIGKAVESLLRPLAPGRVTAAGVSGENQKISAIVSSIAQEFGFNAVLNLSDSKGDPTIGTLYGSKDQTFIPMPQSLWAVLNQIARDTGYTVYVTPTKDLVFGEPGAGLETIKLSYGSAQTSNGLQPCMNVQLEHHPRRNSTFRVVVISHDPGRAASVIGRADYIGANYAGAHGLSQGVSMGKDATAADKSLAALKTDVNKVALYTFHVDGLSQEQADLRAATIATDIAKRELILTAETDGIPDILPTQQIKIQGPLVPTQFTSMTYYVSHYSHRFTMPSQARHVHSAGDGWTTHFSGLNIPTLDLARATEG